MTWSRLGIAAACAATIAFAPRIASAQPTSAADAAAADALYDEADKLMEAGRFGEACPKFAESYRIDPATGALLALAACYEKAGKIASAWTTYRQVVARALREKDAERADASKARVEELEPRLPRLTIRLAPAVRSIGGLEVLRDGTRVDAESASTPVPVDAGEHVVNVRAPHHVAWTRSVMAAEGKTAEIDVDALVPGPDGAAAPTPPVNEGGSEGGLSTLQLVGVGTASVGVVGLVVGTIFGVSAMGAASELDDNGYDSTDGTCKTNVSTCPELYDDASSRGTLSTVFFISGAVLTAAGVTLIVVGGDDDDGGASPDAGLVLTPTFGGALLRGTL